MSQAGVLVERTFEVDVPADRAWELLADVARWPEWAPHITSASVDPPGAVGPTSHGRFRFRPTGRGAFRMTAWDPPRSWTWTGRAMGVTIDYDHAFEPIDDRRSRAGSCGPPAGGGACGPGCSPWSTRDSSTGPGRGSLTGRRSPSRAETPGSTTIARHPGRHAPHDRLLVAQPLVRAVMSLGWSA